MFLTGGTTKTLHQLNSAWTLVGGAQRRLLESIADLDAHDPSWSQDGYRGLPQWLSARLGISTWAARRWINAAHALSDLPLITAALESGDLSLDRVLELCRFATHDTEPRLISWARRVTVSTIRAKADVANRPPLEDVCAAEGERYLRYWWYDDGTCLGLEGCLPADSGAVVATALDRIAGRMPDIVSDDDPPPYPVTYEDSVDVRRADALVALASAHIAADADPERTTVVVHAPLAALDSDDRGCELERGPVIHPETMRRLGCDCRLEILVHDALGNPVGIGRAARNVPQRIIRALRHRDRGCTFPGCGAKWFLKAHHIWWWGRGGPTDVDNLVLCCHYHHKLVHEGGWDVRLNPDGTSTWIRPNGKEFEPQRAPPRELETLG